MHKCRLVQRARVNSFLFKAILFNAGGCSALHGEALSIEKQDLGACDWNGSIRSLKSMALCNAK